MTPSIATLHLEINVTFRYNPKKVRWVWFFKNTQRQTRGSTELLFKNLLFVFTRKKFGDRNEDDRFQAMAFSASLYNVRS